jgi:hypothetical protein
MEYNILVGHMGVVYVNPDNNFRDPNDSASLSPKNTFMLGDIRVMRNTGYEDCHGNPIYDGDYLKRNTGEIRLVAWDGEIGSWTLIRDGEPIHYLRANVTKNYEVWGNYYEPYPTQEKLARYGIQTIRTFIQDGDIRMGNGQVSDLVAKALRDIEKYLE